MTLHMKIKTACCIAFGLILPLYADLNENNSKKDYAPYPQPDSGYVTDLANLLTIEEEEEIEVWLWQVESKTGVEIAVLTINSISDYPGTSNSSLQSFAKGLFNEYGIGNMPKNNGILLLIAKKDRKAKIELGAYYGHTRDMDALKIMDNKIIPYFKKDAYAKGIMNGVKAIVYEFSGCRIGIPWNLIIMLLAIPVCILIAYSLFKNGKRGWGWVVIGMIFIIILVSLRVIFTIIKHLPSSRSSSWSSGGFGGGFGGGFSGGGGASGSW